MVYLYCLHYIAEIGWLLPLRLAVHAVKQKQHYIQWNSSGEGIYFSWLVRIWNRQVGSELSSDTKTGRYILYISLKLFCFQYFLVPADSHWACWIEQNIRLDIYSLINPNSYLSTARVIVVKILHSSQKSCDCYGMVLWQAKLGMLGFKHFR